MRYINSKNRSIMREMISADFKVRYQGSVLGYLWSLLRPLFLFAILYVVFTKVFNVGEGVPNFPVYLLLGIVLWNFFSEATVVGVSAIVSKGELIRKISIPRYIAVLSTTASAFINLLLNLIVVFALAFISGIRPTAEWLLFPLVIGEILVLALAVTFFLSALYVKFRDVVYIWEVFMQAAFYATPILYPMSLIPDKYQLLFFINPMAQIMQDARYIIVTHDATTAWQLGGLKMGLASIALVVLGFFAARQYFRRQAKWFAEYL